MEIRVNIKEWNGKKQKLLDFAKIKILCQKTQEIVSFDVHSTAKLPPFPDFEKNWTYLMNPTILAAIYG